MFETKFSEDFRFDRNQFDESTEDLQRNNRREIRVDSTKRSEFRSNDFEDVENVSMR